MSELGVAVITGAASGIGFQLAKACLKSGMHVVMADKAALPLSQKVRELAETTHLSVQGIVCDVCIVEDIERLAALVLQGAGRIDYLFNNAGIFGKLAPLWELSISEIRDVLDVNLYGVIHTTKIFLPLLFQQSHRSHIVNIASFYGLVSGSLVSAYTMSKHAIVALSESLHFELQKAEKPVDISVACPSFTNTSLLKESHPVFQGLLERGRDAEEIAMHIVKEAQKKVFYILPDREIKQDCQERVRAIVHQEYPFQSGVDKVILALQDRTRS